MFSKIQPLVEENGNLNKLRIRAFILIIFLLFLMKY